MRECRVIFTSYLTIYLRRDALVQNNIHNNIYIRCNWRPDDFRVHKSKLIAFRFLVHSY